MSEVGHALKLLPILKKKPLIQVGKTELKVGPAALLGAVASYGCFEDTGLMTWTKDRKRTDTPGLASTRPGASTTSGLLIRTSYYKFFRGEISMSRYSGTYTQSFAKCGGLKTRGLERIQ